MRTLLVIAAVVLILIVLGVLSFRSSDEDITIRLDKVRARDATEQVIERGKEVGNAVVDQTEKLLDRSTGEEPVPPQQHE